MRFLTPAAVLLLALAIPQTAFAAGKLDHWAQRYDLRGTWQKKDADHDGVKNRAEFTLNTNPRRADTDRDGLRDGDELQVGSDPRRVDSDGDGTRDGDENAGVITAFDGAVLTMRRFHGTALDVVVEPDADCAGSDADEGYVDTDETSDADVPPDAEDPAADPDEAETTVDLGGDDDYGYAGCSDPRIKPGTVISSLQFQARDGDLVATAINFAPKLR